MSIHSTISRKIRDGLDLIKAVASRDEGLDVLEQCPMNLKLLKETEAGVRLRRILRHCERARALHDKWLAQAENEIISHWDEAKYLFLNPTDARTLDHAQAVYNASLDNTQTVSSPVPVTPGRHRDDSTTDVNSSFNRDFNFLTPSNDRFSDGAPRTPGHPRTPRFNHNDTDDSVDEMMLSSEGSFPDPQVPEKRGRGRPRKHPVKDEFPSRKGRRGRPPLKR